MHRLGKRLEQRDAAQQLKLPLRDRHFVERRKPAAEQRREDRQEGAGDDQRAADVHGGDQQRRQDRADPDRRDPETLNGAEYAGQHVVGHGALEQRERRHVDERVAEPDHGKEQKRRSRLGKTPIRAIGMPQSRIPTKKFAVSRRPISVAETSAPTSPPIPTAEFRKPTPSSPSSSSSSAETTIRTLSAPATSVCAASSLTRTRSPGSRKMVTNPAVNSRGRPRGARGARAASRPGRG